MFRCIIFPELSPLGLVRPNTGLSAHLALLPHYQCDLEPELHCDVCEEPSVGKYPVARHYDKNLCHGCRAFVKRIVQVSTSELFEMILFVRMVLLRFPFRLNILL